MVFITEGFFEVAIESWPEWDWNPRPNRCFNLFIFHDNSFDNQGSEINKNDIFLRLDILYFTKTFFLVLNKHKTMNAINQ